MNITKIEDYPTTTLNKLEEEYKRFYAPAFTVWVNDQNISLAKVSISNLTVELTMENKLDVATFSVNNAYNPMNETFRWLDDYFVAGHSIKIALGYSDKLKTIFEGLITTVKPEMPKNGEARVMITAMDQSYPMLQAKRTSTWENKKHSAIIQDICKSYGFKPVVDDTTVTYKQVIQEDLEDLNFIYRLANLNGYECFTVGKLFYFRKPHQKQKSLVTLSWGGYVKELTIEVNILKQLSAVIVKGWNPDTQEVIESKATEIVYKVGTQPKTGADLMKKYGENTTEIVCTNVDSEEEAKTIAEALLYKRSMDLVSGEGEMFGLPDLRAGRYISVKERKTSTSRLYYLFTTTHLFQDSGYSTRFTLRSNAI